MEAIFLPNSKVHPWPFVSIVVPVYNRSQMLGQCLYTLCRQSYPKERYEIIIVDDGSTDDSAEIAQSIGREWAGSLRVIQQENHGPSSARNAGIFASQADYIAFTDSDCIPDLDWLRSLVLTLTATQSDGVGGPIANEAQRSWVADYLLATHFFRHRERRGSIDYLLTANVIFKREALLAVQGFSRKKGVWGEDADLSFRLKQSGFILALSTQGQVTHYGAPGSFRRLIQDLYRYGRGNAILSRHWSNQRTPPWELLRHSAAAMLAPIIAFRLIRTAGFIKALSFLPLIVTEHLAFCCGLLRGIVSQEAWDEK